MADPIKKTELEEFLVSYSTNADGTEYITGAQCRQLEYYLIDGEQVGAKVVVVPFASIDTDDFKGVLDRTNQATLDTLNAQAMQLKQAAEDLEAQKAKTAELQEEIDKIAEASKGDVSLKNLLDAAIADANSKDQRIIVLEKVHEENIAERAALHDRIAAMQTEIDTHKATIAAKDAEISGHLEENNSLVSKIASTERLLHAVQSSEAAGTKQDVG